ncbi:hypothetical protein pneo_cds_247 [Pandoravirus neocaledonia]|uniref:Uncharacterized protein n=1 Tax=Pandoravirus neocaledonia TaxID=2107708 RepID=A0A2U7UBN4_9VIRU|nr:hypothetical protein pneo_cds_247 [Pandoravirus neocaledonia]AVK75854.1 hypothetical protein pneo_cds_247 [Pandoravirus neocaledonia]
MTATTGAARRAIEPAAHTTGAPHPTAAFSTWFRDLAARERIPLDIAMAASAMLCALPDRYYARYRHHDARYQWGRAHAPPIQHHGHQRRAAIGCVRIALKWAFDCFSAAQGCRGLDLYLEPSTASWVWHEVDILSHLDWTIGRFFVQTPLPSRPLSSAPPSLTSSSLSSSLPTPFSASQASRLPQTGSAMMSSAPARPNLVSICDRRSLAVVARPQQHTVYPVRASRAQTPTEKTRSPAEQPLSTTATMTATLGGPATGDHAAVSLIPRRRATRTSNGPSRRSRVAHAVRPVREHQEGPTCALVDARAPTPAANCLAASSDAERSARSRYENRTSAEARSMAPASARSTSASTGSVPRAVTQPLVLHVGM